MIVSLQLTLKSKLKLDYRPSCMIATTPTEYDLVSQRLRAVFLQYWLFIKSELDN